MSADLSVLRQEIDQINQEMTRLFVRRMDISAQVAAYKREHNLPVLDAAREEIILQKVAEWAGEPYAAATRKFFQAIMQISRDAQTEILSQNS